MAKLDIGKLKDDELAKLVDARWSSSSELWDIVQRVYKTNTATYENRADWLQFISERRRRFRVQANRIFVNMESVINSLIDNPPGINVLPSRDGQVAQDFARKLESFFRKKYDDLNIKEVFRMGLRNLYFARLIVIKPYWDATLGESGDFNYRAIDPRNIRVGKYARKEQDSEFAIEEIEDNLCAVIDRFPDKSKELMTKYGLTDEVQLYTQNPDVKYKEAWINDYVIFKLDNIILGCIKNPYWDWEGILITDDEEQQLSGSDGQPGVEGEARRAILQGAKQQQDQRQAQYAQQQNPAQQMGTQPAQPQATQSAPLYPSAPADGSQPPAPMPEGEFVPGTDEQAESAFDATDPTPAKLKPYYFNYFDKPRKPYIFATIFNNENTPIGRTDMITLSLELQRGIDKRKMDIDENCELVNGMLKVDAQVMPKADAQRIRFETKGIIWGKGVKDGVSREMGTPLPAFVQQDMLDSREEIDNIMAATSAFKGQQEGVETKAGRLALIQQSYLRLNELSQVVDYVSKEVFEWGMQFAKTRYTEYHYAKWMGKEGAREVIEIIQDDFETGSEVTIISGKTLPVDDEFKYEQAQADVKSGFISPIDYMEIAGYDSPKTLAKNALLFRLDPFDATGVTQEERQGIPPPIPVTQLREALAFADLPAAAKVQYLARLGITITQQDIDADGDASVSINYSDMPPDAQVQALAQLGIKVNPAILVAEQMAENQKENEKHTLEVQGKQKVLAEPPAPAEPLPNNP